MSGKANLLYDYVHLHSTVIHSFRSKDICLNSSSRCSFLPSFLPFFISSSPSSFLPSFLPSFLSLLLLLLILLLLPPSAPPPSFFFFFPFLFSLSLVLPFLRLFQLLILVQFLSFSSSSSPSSFLSSCKLCIFSFV